LKGKVTAEGICIATYGAGNRSPNHQKANQWNVAAYKVEQQVTIALK